MVTTAASVLVSGSRRSSRPARGRMIRVRVSDEEYAALAEKGAAVGGMSKLLRDHLEEVSVRHRDDERQRLATLNRINANLNMITRWVNTHKSAADAVQVMVYLADVRREIGQVLTAMDQR
jgi:mobilization protein NikA